MQGPVGGERPKSKNWWKATAIAAIVLLILSLIPSLYLASRVPAPPRVWLDSVRLDGVSVDTQGLPCGLDGKVTFRVSFNIYNNLRDKSLAVKVSIRAYWAGGPTIFNNTLEKIYFLTPLGVVTPFEPIEVLCSRNAGAGSAPGGGAEVKVLEVKETV